MKRALLIHWNGAETAQRAGWLRAAGYEAACHSDQGSTVTRHLREHDPNVVVIDLSRLPSHGRAVATVLRQQKATRHLPLVFVGGHPEKVAAVKQLLPDATYTEWDRIGAALKKALAKAPGDPVVPSIMEGYSGTPLPKKLGIRAGSLVAMLGPPPGFEKKLDPLPEKVRLKKRAGTGANLVLVFAKSRKELEMRFDAAARCLAQGGGIWMIWPKKASGIPTDLSENHVRALGLDNGFVDYKVCAVDEVWSGLLFARKRP